MVSTLPSEDIFSRMIRFSENEVKANSTAITKATDTR